MSNQTQFDDGSTTINNGVLTTNYGVFNYDVSVNRNLSCSGTSTLNNIVGTTANISNITGNYGVFNYDVSVNRNLSCSGTSTLNNTYIAGKLGIGTSSPNSIITVVVNGTASPAENWNNNWVVVGNAGELPVV